MRRSGTADLPLHGGRVPQWLAKRMAALGGAITEAVVIGYGKAGFLQRLSDPHWFQAFGAVLGMDWHSSGITTSVMGALKRSVNPMAAELGIYICGGRGKHSRKTPDELLKIGYSTGLDATNLIRSSKLTAKVDNTAVQDGFQLYLHTFVLTDEGEWVVIQQGMNQDSRLARRYHWHSQNVKSFVVEPHTAVCGINQGQILNLTAREAETAREGILAISRERPAQLLPEIKKLVMPLHHDVREKDVDLKRLGAVIALANEQENLNFENLLLLQGLGPRTLQSLALVSEVIHGTPSRFKDPARFSFAHGGKDGHPFPVPTKVYDETIESLKESVNKAKVGHTDKSEAIKRLHHLSVRLEKDFKPVEGGFEQLIEKERQSSWKYGGKTVFGDATPPGSFKIEKDKKGSKGKGGQLELF